LNSSGMSIEDRFWSKVQINGLNECWLWLGPRNGKDARHDYGRYSISSRQHEYAHRFAYEILVGEIPDGLVIDRLCRNHACVNPAHLEVVTSKQNTLRGDTLAAKELLRTHCLRGHPLSGQNLILTSRGRTCRKCKRELMRLWYVEHRIGELAKHHASYLARSRIRAFGER
jgi:hypothetical protein